MKLIKINIQIEKPLAAIVLLGAVLLSGCSDPSNNTQNTNVNAYLTQAQSYLDTNQYKAAYSVANNAIKEDPENIEGYLILAKLNKLSGHSRNSIKMLESYQGNKNSEYYFALLDAYQASGKSISAQTLIDQYLSKLQEQPQRLQFTQAKQLLLKKQWSGAKSAFTKLTEVPEYKVDSMVALANIEASLNNPDKALVIIDEVAQLDPENVDNQFLKSMIYFQKGELAETEQALSQALSSLPTTDVFTAQRIKIIQALAKVLTLQGRSSEAMIYTRILAEEFPGTEAVAMQYDRAMELFKNQQYVAAKELLFEILDSIPEHQKASTLLGLIFYKEGDPKNAEKYLAKIVDPEISPLKLTELYAVAQLQQNKSEDVLSLLESIPEEDRNVDTWVLYSNAAIQQKKFALAKMGLDKVTALAPESIQTSLLTARYYNNLPVPQMEVALASLSGALSLEPQNPSLQAFYVEQLIKLNKKADADNYIRHLANTYKTHKESLLIVANYYISQKKFNEAKQSLESILAIDETNIQALYSMAKVNQLTNNWQLALNNYTEIMRNYPSELVPYLGSVFNLLKLEKDPLNASSYLPKNYDPSLLALTLADITQQQNKFNLAEQYIQEAGNALPAKYRSVLDNITLQLSIKKARVAVINKDYPAARKITLSAIQKSPENVRLLSLLSYIEINSGQYQEATKINSQIAAILPDNSLATRLDAEILTRQGEYQEAINLLHVYWDQVKDEDVAEQLHLISRDKVKKTKPTLDFLNEWQRTLPESITAKRYKAIYLQSKGDTEQALNEYAQLLQQAPNDVVSLNNAAWLYFQEQKNNKRAVILAEQAYKLQPDNAAIADTYGWILFNTGSKEHGRALVEQASKMMPDDQSIQEHYIAVTQ